MFNFKKNTQFKNVNLFDTDQFISENKKLIFNEGNGHLELTYNEISGNYEANFRFPILDENGNEVNYNYPIAATATYSFSPLYCKLCHDIYTLNDFVQIDFNKTKKEALKDLLAKIENL